MEVNKENVFKTKIPLPTGELPALPKHLLEKKKHPLKQNSVPARVPLKTLGNQISPTAGSSNNSNKPRSFININTKNVTVRRRSDDLDWHYSVFRDKEVDDECSIISISDNESNQDKTCFEDKNDLNDGFSSFTPILKGCLESNRVRNIKRSLKRPHSRELQGLSPVNKRDKYCENVKRRLPFNESLQDRLQSPDHWKICYMECLDQTYVTDIFEYFLNVEAKPLGVPRTSSITRACVINWLMRVNGTDGNPSTVQTACWYLDSILASVHVPLDKLQLTAAACYWIAQKFHGPVTPAAKLVKCANKAFTADRLLHAEIAVLKKMRFNPQPVVVQDYIGYLSWCCDQKHGGEIEVAATFIYLCGLMTEKVLCDEYPSVIAIAAVKNALYLLRKKDLMYKMQNTRIFRTAEKKTINLSLVCSVLRRAVRTISSPLYEYKTPLEQYSFPPNYIAQRIVTAANDLSVFDARNTAGRC